MSIQKKQFLYVLSALLVFSAVILAIPSVRAQLAEVNITGYLWSSENGAGAGWISTDCATGGSGGSNVCGISNYGLSVNSNDQVNGYLWSSNIGWIRFGGLSGCPSGTCQARIVSAGSNYEMQGWARACSVYNSGCSGSLKSDAYRGGWDGWISLSCNNHGGCGSSNYKVLINTNGDISSNSYAWGGDLIGAVSFDLMQLSCSSSGRQCTPDGTGVMSADAMCNMVTTTCSTGSLCDPGTITCVSITTANVQAEIVFGSDFVRAGDTTTVSWVFSGSVPNGVSCRAVSSTGHTVNSNGGASESVPQGEVEYTLYCSANGGAEFEVDKKSLRALPSARES